LGNLAELDQKYDEALSWFQKSHTAFLAEHNWSYHLYVLYGYARLARKQGNFTQAYWYIDLVDKASQGEGFGLLQREVTAEKLRLEQDAVDLLIDSRKGMIKTRESGKIDLKKQYVLLHILEALSNAHRKSGDDLDRGLSKAEIIEQVWHESYRPEAHDNKLYYNINRLRRLIEPDLKKPQYLLNWKEGYRLAPGLRVHYIGGRTGIPVLKEGEVS
jgi:DNA-binding winged helix-turn-helix (wHTH) protein